MWKKYDHRFLSNHYRTRKNIVITKKSRIESQRASCDMHHYDTIDSIADKKVLVGSDNEGFVEGSDNGWIVCMYVCVYVFVCIYLYIRHIYVYMYVYMYIYIYIYMYICIYVCMCVCMYIFYMYVYIFFSLLLLWLLLLYLFWHYESHKLFASTIFRYPWYKKKHLVSMRKRKTTWTQK